MKNTKLIIQMIGFIPAFLYFMMTLLLSINQLLIFPKLLTMIVLTSCFIIAPIYLLKSERWVGFLAIVIIV